MLSPVIDDGVYAHLDDSQKLVARRLFLELVNLGEGQAHVRARIPMPSGGTKSDKTKLEVIEKFAGPKARLLVTGSDRPHLPPAKEGSTNPIKTASPVHSYLEIAHDALISNWQQLRGWLGTNRDQLRSRTAIVWHRNEWEKHGRRDDLLLQAFNLARALSLLAYPGDVEVDDLSEYVKRSAAREAKRSTISKGLRLVGAFLTLALALGAGFVASERQRLLLSLRDTSVRFATAAALRALGDQGNLLRLLAKRPNIHELLRGSEQDGEPRLDLPSFYSVILFDKEGIPRARFPKLRGQRELVKAKFKCSKQGQNGMHEETPSPAEGGLDLNRSWWKRSFAFREYFQGAKRLADEHAADPEGTRYFTARPFCSEDDGEFKYAISLPIFDGDNWIGVLAGTAPPALTTIVPGPGQPDRVQTTIGLMGFRGRERNDPDSGQKLELRLLTPSEIDPGKLDAATIGRLFEHSRLRQVNQWLQNGPVGAPFIDCGDKAPKDLGDPIEAAQSAGDHTWRALFGPIGCAGLVVFAGTLE